MPRELDPLQSSMADDLRRILASSPALEAAYLALPDEERQRVDDHFLELAWQTIMGAASFIQGVPADDVPEYVRAFGGFVLDVQRGKQRIFVTSDWVAMNRETFNAVEPALRKLNENFDRDLKDLPNE